MGMLFNLLELSVELLDEIIQDREFFYFWI